MSQILVTIVGLRFHIAGGEEAIPAFQAAHPAGSLLLLHLNGKAHPYPGSIACETEDFEDVGTVTSEDIYLVLPLFGSLREGGSVEAVVVRHEQKALVVAVEDVGQLSLPPQMLHVEPELGEPLLQYTTSELLSQHAGDRLEQLLVKDPASPRIEKSLTQYLQCCTASLSADDMYQRRRILVHLQQSAAQLTPQVQALTQQLEQQIHDFKHKENIYKVYQEQISQIQAQTAQAYLSQCEAADPNPDLAHLRQLLNVSTKGLFVQQPLREEFISHLYYLFPDRSTLYLIYGRLMRYDALCAARQEAEVAVTKDKADLFLDAVGEVLADLYARCPKVIDIVDPAHRSRQQKVTLNMQKSTLDALFRVARSQWKTEIEAFLGCRKAQKGEEFNPGSIFLLLGWIRRNTQIFHLLPKKEMARLLCQREGCRYKITTMETYITKATDDLDIYADYPLMMRIEAWMKEKHPNLWGPEEN